MSLLNSLRTLRPLSGCGISISFVHSYIVEEIAFECPKAVLNRCMTLFAGCLVVSGSASAAVTWRSFDLFWTFRLPDTYLTAVSDGGCVLVTWP